MTLEQQLQEAGWPADDRLQPIIKHAHELIEQGRAKDFDYLNKQLKRAFPDDFASLRMREKPALISLAVRAETPEAERNLAKARSQMEELLKCPVITRGALMPDACPAGDAAAAIPVGGAIETLNAIIPAAHGGDICCSLHASFFQSELSVPELMEQVQASTRFGPGGRQPSEQILHPVLDEPVWDNPFLSGLQDKAVAHLADQGDGNHFAFLGEMEVGERALDHAPNSTIGTLFEQLKGERKWKVLVTHHGSRSLGSTVFLRGLEAAVKHTRIHARGIPDEAAWLDAESTQGRDYWEALQYLARWTKANHRCIHEGFAERIGAKIIAEAGNEHNFVWRRGERYLHGKGATPAWPDASGPRLGLIPLNLAEPILLTEGSDHERYLSFSPHGAGRNLSRRALVRRYMHKKRGFNQAKLDADLAKSTEGIEVRWYHGQPDISESPLAYKSAETIRKQIAEHALAKVVAEIRPLGSLMAGRSLRQERPMTPKEKRQIEHRKERRKVRQRDWEDWTE